MAEGADIVERPLGLLPQVEEEVGMPCVSKAQARWMRLVAAGKLVVPGFTAEQASEWVDGHPTSDLPERAVPRCRLYGGTPPCPDADDTCRTLCDPE